MILDITSSAQQLTELDKKMQDIDGILKDIRTKIQDILWNLIELKNHDKKGKMKKDFDS